MKLILIIPILFLFGCNGKKAKPALIKVSEKFCIQACVYEEFKAFHNKGGSWGTGSSSMNGLQQVNIYKEVYKKCEEFYQPGTCYYDPQIYGRRIHRIHDIQYGQPKKIPNKNSKYVRHGKNIVEMIPVERNKK